MDDAFVYLEDLSEKIPEGLIEVSFLVMCCIIIFIFALTRSFQKARKGVMITLLSEYIFFLLCATIFCRSVRDSMKYNLIPFWSYGEIANGGKEAFILMMDNIQNLFILMPMGLLLGLIIMGRRWWKAALIGFVFSSFIELSQLVFRRGFCEWDDVIHNTLGCIFGYGIGVLIIKYTKRLVYKK